MQIFLDDFSKILYTEETPNKRLLQLSEVGPNKVLFSQSSIEIVIFRVSLWLVCPLFQSSLSGIFSVDQIKAFKPSYLIILIDLG